MVPAETFKHQLRAFRPGTVGMEDGVDEMRARPAGLEDMP